MIKRETGWLVVALAIVAMLQPAVSGSPSGSRVRVLEATYTEDEAVEAPEFTHSEPGEWLNSEPLTLASLRGNIVLIDFWTFECWNCYRSFPWLNALETKYGERGLKVIGVHSPEFRRERNVARVAAKMEEFELAHPVMIDNDHSYWKAIANRAWPTFYLIDDEGRIRHVSVGEMHEGDERARRLEGVVKALLAEK